ncbi:DUF6879 family protein [Nonomuraea typhae]|uniref:DUF6879 family protein n=1 Tax=Nonomuraea typhae TaxID=2603600 RepID=UPI0012FC6ACD|nr:DUF6879 family protein [Nonomuraea typhae]
MLDGKELAAYIDERFTSTLFRLEQLPVYDVAANGDDLARYLAGEPGPDMGRKGPWLDVIRDEVSRGLNTYRVHVVKGPLTDYERFEFEWGFALNAEAGEHIRILDLTEVARPAQLIDEDFWLIGEDHGVRMYYNDVGNFVGANPVVDRETIRAYRAARTAAWNTGVPFARYWRDHPHYWRERPAA